MTVSGMSSAGPSALPSREPTRPHRRAVRRGSPDKAGASELLQESFAFEFASPIYS